MNLGSIDANNVSGVLIDLAGLEKFNSFKPSGEVEKDATAPPKKLFCSEMEVLKDADSGLVARPKALGEFFDECKDTTIELNTWLRSIRKRFPNMEILWRSSTAVTRISARLF